MKLKILTLGIILISLISLTSAIGLELEDLGNVSSGDFIQRNLTIQADNLLVYLSHNSSEGINLSYDSPIQVNGIETIIINISLDKYLESDNYSFTIYANAEKEIASVNSGGSSGGSSCNYYLSKNLYKKSYLISLRKNCNINFELKEKHSLEFRGTDLLGNVIILDRLTKEEYLIKEENALCLKGEVDGLEILVKSQSNSRVQLDLNLRKVL